MLRKVVFTDCLAKVVARAPMLRVDVFTKALMDNTAESCLLLPRNLSASVRLGYTRHGTARLYSARLGETLVARRRAINSYT